MRLLQRYILGELVRVFAFLLSVLTILLVFVGVIGEAAKSGLGPMQIVQILPYIVPSLLPFTIPATLLLTVCVVYGRIAGDQEITAVKAAGISVMAVLWPSFFLAGLLSVCTLILTDQFIPWARGNIQRTVTSAVEDIFLDVLRTQQVLADSRNGITITVLGVNGRTLVMPTFRYITPGGTVVTIQAQEATIEFNLDRQEVMLHFVRANINTGNGANSMYIEREDKPFPLPQDHKKRTPRELTIRDIRREMDLVAHSREDMEQKQVMAAAIALTRGDFGRFFQPDFHHYAAMIGVHTERYKRLEIEVHARFALSCSCLFFVLVGSPFSILQARRQFLTSFALCFMPILAIYYPVFLLCMNLSKSHSFFHPAWTMWIANLILFVAGSIILWKVSRN